MNWLKTHGLLIVTTALICFALWAVAWLLTATTKHDVAVATWDTLCAEQGGVLLEASKTYVCVRKDALIYFKVDSK